MQASDIFQKARIKLLIDSPFFGVLAVQLQEREMTDEIEKLVMVPTAATDGRYLYVNREWAEKLTDDEKVGLLAHEILHNALGHVFEWRKGTREARRWNAAGDFVINLILKNSGFKLPAGGLLDDKYKDMATEQVYDALPKVPEMKIIDVICAGCGGKPGGKDGKSGSSKGGKDGKEGTDAGGEMATISPRDLERLWKERVAEALHAAKSRGDTPAGLERLVDQILQPRIPWQVLLEQFLTASLRDDYDMLRSDRRFIKDGIYLPDLYNEGAEILIGIDTSGSIGHDDLIKFVSETVGILKSRRVTKTRLMACDADITMDIEMNPWDELPNDFPGGGGTDFRPFFARAEELGIKPACAVIFTDMDGRFPDETPAFPVIWVSTNEDAKAPFGWVVHYDANEVVPA